MTAMRFIYEETRHGGGVCPGQEDSDWPDYEDEYIEIEPVCLLKGSEPLGRFYGGADAVELEGDENSSFGWVVYVRYSDGDTFSWTGGYTETIKAFDNNKSAEALAQSVRDGGSGGLGYKPWEGYFSGLQSVEVRKLAIMDSL